MASTLLLAALLAACPGEGPGWADVPGPAIEEGSPRIARVFAVPEDAKQAFMQLASSLLDEKKVIAAGEGRVVVVAPRAALDHLAEVAAKALVPPPRRRVEVFRVPEEALGVAQQIVANLYPSSSRLYPSSSRTRTRLQRAVVDEDLGLVVVRGTEEELRGIGAILSEVSRIAAGGPPSRPRVKREPAPGPRPTVRRVRTTAPRRIVRPAEPAPVKPAPVAKRAEGPEPGPARMLEALARACCAAKLPVEKLSLARDERDGGWLIELRGSVVSKAAADGARDAVLRGLRSIFAGAVLERMALRESQGAFSVSLRIRASDRAKARAAGS